MCWITDVEHRTLIPLLHRDDSLIQGFLSAVKRLLKSMVLDQSLDAGVA